MFTQLFRNALRRTYYKSTRLQVSTHKHVYVQHRCIYDRVKVRTRQVCDTTELISHRNCSELFHEGNKSNVRNYCGSPFAFGRTGRPSARARLYIIIVNDTENVIMNFSVNYTRHTYICISQILFGCAFLREVLPRVIIVYHGYAVYV